MLNALIIDDEAPARSELRFLLEETGRVDTIEEASNAREAVELLVRYKDCLLYTSPSPRDTR